ncbi:MULTISPECIES: tetratricopeptide repeat protein [unclassified Streptomyces]
MTSTQAVPPPRGRGKVLRRSALALALAAGLSVGALAFDGRDAPRAPAVAAAPAGRLDPADLPRGVTALQAHLKAQPKDATAWASLGAAYVEQARTNGDPTRYAQAEHALEHSLKLRPTDNDAALAGRAALAAARHDFTGALTAADAALAINAYDELALALRVDALVELGRYDEALVAARTADDRKPGIPVFSRLAYVHELRGDTNTAGRILTQALGSATGPGDRAYVATALAQLFFGQGQFVEAGQQVDTALRADPDYLPALETRARIQYARGDLRSATLGMEQVVARYPLPGQLVALGELYEAAGRGADARSQYRLVAAWTALAHAHGVDTDLDTALAEADHGDPVDALRAARAEWAKRQTVHTADALAWALHVNGRDAEALPYAERATAPGYRNATFLYHQGVIERAAGGAIAARRDLTAALTLNPAFSPTGSPLAREAVAALTGAS